MYRRATFCIAAGVCLWSCTLLEGATNLTECDVCDSGLGSSYDSGAGVPDQGGTSPGDDSGSGGAEDSGPPDSAGSDSGAADSGAGSDSGKDGGKDAGPPPTFASAYAAAVMLDKPIGYWPLGDPTTSSTCHDESGNGHDGILKGGVSLAHPGPFSDGSITSASFFGDGTEDIDVGATFSFSGADPFSWEIWVKPTTLPPSDSAFLSAMQYDGVGGPNSGEYLITSSGSTTLGFEIYSPSSPGFVTIECGGTGGLSASAWSYVVATWDGSMYASLYVNGVAVCNDQGLNDPSQVPTPSGVDTLIGQYFPGTASEVAIYDHVLTAGQVQAHWQAGTVKQ